MVILVCKIQIPRKLKINCCFHIPGYVIYNISLEVDIITLGGYDSYEEVPLASLVNQIFSLNKDLSNRLACHLNIKKVFDCNVSYQAIN